MTDLMVSPEAIDAYLTENPPPDEHSPVREQTIAFHDWHKLVAYPETCEACRYRAALEEILDVPLNATVLNAHYIAKEALLVRPAGGGGGVTAAISYERSTR